MTDDIPKDVAERPRREVPPIKVWVTDAEKAEIADRAAQVGMSRSAYLLALGLNQPIRSVVDLKAVADLAKVNGDAGLLKLWLSERRGEGAHPMDVETMMYDFRRLQLQVLDLMGKVVRDS